MHQNPRNKSAPNLAGPGALLEPIQASSNGSPHLYYTLPLFNLIDEIESNQAEIRRLNILDHVLLGDYSFGIPARDDPAVMPLAHSPEWWQIFEQCTVAISHNYYDLAHLMIDSLRGLA